MKQLLYNILLIWSLCPFLQAQTNTWQVKQPETYVFQLTNEEAQELFLKSNQQDELVKKFITRPPYTTFLNKWEDHPDKGHFLFVNIEGQRIKYRYQPFIPYRVLMLPVANYDYVLQVIDENGNARGDASVRFYDKNNKSLYSLNYNPRDKTYTHSTKKNQEFHTIIELDGMRSFIYGLKGLSFTYVSGSSDPKNPLLYGYMISDKYIYQPGDTVRIKSYLVDEDHKPLNKKLTLATGRRYTFKEIETLQPHLPGNYSGEFVLDPSFDLKKGTEYEIRLVDEDQVIHAVTTFKYIDRQPTAENYKLQITPSSPGHFFPDTNHVRITVKDSTNNQLVNLPATITILRKYINDSFDNYYSLPDTILQQQVILDKDSPAITIPAELFGAANVNYYIQADVTLPDGTLLTEIKTYYFIYKEKKITCKPEEGMLLFEYTERGESIPATAALWYNEDTTTHYIRLPHREPLNSAISQYTFKADKMNKPVTLKTKEIADIQIKGEFINGVFHASLHNPYNINVTWHLYKNRQLIQRGYGNQINIRQKVSKKDKNLDVEVFYELGDQAEAISERFYHLPQNVRITTNLPEYIQPGTETEVTITVTDFKGNPVSNVDLTAFAVNGSLNEHFYALPYYGDDHTYAPKPPVEPQKFNRFKLEKTITVDSDLVKKMIDTNTPFYRLINPEYNNLFIHTEKTPDSVTQFAPFIIFHGQYWPAKAIVIECDDVPVWFSWTENPYPYSFPVEPGIAHTITLRTLHKVFTIKTEPDFFKPGMRTIISIPDNSWPKHIHKGKNYTFELDSRWAEPTAEETEHYQKYIAQIPVYPEDSCTFLRQGNKEIVIQKGKNKPEHYYATAGPILPGLTSYNGLVEYQHEGGYRYILNENQMEKEDGKDLVPEKLGTYRTYNSKETIKIYSWEEEPEAEPSLNENFYPFSPLFSLDDYHYPTRFIISQDSIDLVLNLNCKHKGVREVSLIKHDIPGLYNIYILFHDEKYMERDSILLQPYTYHSISFGEEDMNEAGNYRPDNVFRTFSESEDRIRAVISYPTLQDNKKTFNPRPFLKPSIELLPPPDRSFTINELKDVAESYKVTGEVYTEEGEPVVDAKIYLKPNAQGARTDMEGKFSLDHYWREESRILQIIHPGYKPAELFVKPGTYINITLKEDPLSLPEQKKEKRVLVITQEHKYNMYNNPISLRNPTGDKEEEIKPGSELPEVAFWQPNLRTNKNGQATFKVTFPPNPTRWDIVIYGINEKLQTGSTLTHIYSTNPDESDTTENDKTDYF